jgi:adenylate kinase family enzyme
MSYSKFNVTGKELVSLYEALRELKNVKGSKMSVFVARNLKEIEFVLKPLEELATPTEEFYNLSVEAQKFIENSDEEGLKKFEADNAEQIKLRQEQLEKVEIELNKYYDVQLTMIKESHIPEEVTAEQIKNIIILIKESVEA